MPSVASRRLRASLVALAATSFITGCGDKDINNLVLTPNVGARFAVTKLVADLPGGAPNVDARLVNPWGIAFGSTGLLWVANNGTGTSTIYDANGVPQSLIVNIPSAAAATGGAPTGMIFNPTTSFTIPSAGSALFIFAGEDGTITAWNTATGTDAQIVADRSASDAVYKGIAIATDAGANFLYATDFHNNAVDVYDTSFGYVRSFTDATIPAGYAPFGIQAINGLLYVTYAKQHAPDNEDDEAGAGNGFVDVFNPNGTLARRFASNGALNAPWAVVMAPAGFGDFGGAILVGNFGDGKINAYSAADGAFLGALLDAGNVPVTIPGLWGLAFGPAASSTALYFSAGPDDEAHGLVGTITQR